MAKKKKIISLICEKVQSQEYEFTIPPFFEEMANDDLIFADVEAAIANGEVHRTFTEDPRGIRYEIIGESTDGRTIAVICRIKETGKLLFITTWEVYE